MGQSVLVNFPADRIILADEGSLFASENVEDALSELSDEIDAERLPAGTEGQVLAVDAEGDPAWVAPVDLSFGASNNFYKILDAIPTAEAEIYEGLIVYEKTGKTLQVCTEPGEHEEDAVTVETGAVTTSGDITIELNGQAVVVSVELDDTAEQVATKIKTAVDAAVIAEAIAGWTVSVDGADILFIKDTVGVCVAPTATDTGLTGVTFSAFARDNEGVDTAWAQLNNSAT